MSTQRVLAGSPRVRPGSSPLGAGLATVVALLVSVLTVLIAPPAAADSSGARALRVMSYNIHTGIGVDGRADLGRIAATIEDADVDVVALQEVDVHWSQRSAFADQAAELARLTGMEVYFAPIYDLDPAPGSDQRRRYGVAVLSRHPILSATNHEITRWSTVDPGAGPRPAPGFAEVVVSVRGKPVHVYDTHLDFRADPSVRERQVADMLAVLRQDPPGARQLLLGDFNAGPGAPELSALWEHVRDAWGERDGGFTYPADEPVKRIDYITVAGPVRVLNAAVPPVTASDHRPVIATVLLT
ncbi:endonuclease/exonuclease/phosphatase family protein [Saccharomonospora xinjiangensis]|uniref:Metal-dependent hydrolase n=1 Tax=Saccharomonospora xinjiangensis XJ-54 TaxID=882086 RepID=I0V775_9PSEU|nr:endonuclease/exonuclease/phosphatase family protein [Saccharomonospora xinjiangensis]EID55978.1 metal-dependent hydrolase [Saccharomonospora xinjiangensis XJ-54]